MVTARRRSLWRRVEWPVVFVLVAATVAAGMVGYQRQARDSGVALDSWDALYASLQLFVMEYNGLSSWIPIDLHVARLAAPGLAAYTALRAVMGIFREEVHTLRVRLSRRHVVIAGLSGMGLTLARSVLRHGLPVAIIDRNTDNPRSAAAREAGAVVLRGDARDPELLAKAGITRAHVLVAACGNDGTNAEIAVRSAAMNTGRRRHPLECRVHITEPQLCSLLLAHELGRPGRAGTRVEFFNIFESAAQAMLADRSPFETSDGTPIPEPHPLVIGLDVLGRSLVIELARTWRNLSGSADLRPLRLTVLAPAATRLLDELRGSLAGFDKVVAATALDVGSDAGTYRDEGRLADAVSSCTAAYVCLGEDRDSLSAGLALARIRGTAELPITVAMKTSDGLATLLEDAWTASTSRISVFGVLDDGCDFEVVLAGVRERIARALHAEYRRAQHRGGHTTLDNPAMVPWEELPEALREANRDHAAHIGRKLESVGCGLIPQTNWDVDPVEFTPSEIERLAIMEHDRWIAERRRNGWKPAPVKDIHRKRTPYLVPWSELSEEIREYDRLFVRDLPSFLARTGFQVVRLEAAGSATSPTLVTLPSS